MIKQLSKSSAVDSMSTANLASFLELSAQKYAAKTAIVYGDTDIKYGELLRRSQAIAEQLLSLGISKDDKVALFFPNQPEFVACFFAVVGIGAVVVPVNPLLKAGEISHILKDSGAKALIAQTGCIDQIPHALSEAIECVHLILTSEVDDEISRQVTESTSPRTVRICTLTKATASSSPVNFGQNTDPERDLALIVYTSGTTGKPKGAMLTHRSISSVMPGPLLSHCNVDENDRWLAMLPLCHIYGLGVIVFSTIALGATIVILEKFDPALALRTIQSERVTLVPAVPSMYQFMVMELAANEYDLSSVRVCFSGAAALSPALFEQIEAAFQAPVVEGYALSETACGATVNPFTARRIGSAGKPLDGVELSIHDENGAKLAAGEQHVGEIAIKGPNVMVGYFNQKAETEEVLKGTRFFTGDLGYLDEDGYLYIVGRKKELIIRGGQNIYPREVEDVIHRIPGVREAAVIGVPDSYMGERVKAIVVTAPGTTLTDEFIKDVCAQHLAPYKVPRLVELREEPLPRNSTGKVLKRLLS